MSRRFRYGVAAWSATAILTSAPRPCPAQDARSVVLTALENESRAPKEMTTFVFTVGTRTSKHEIRRVAPDRTHAIFVGAGGEPQELIIIGRQAYHRREGTWQRSASTVQGEAVPSVATFLAQRLENVTEESPTTEDGVAVRVFRARIRWPADSGPNRGDVTFLIASSSLLPHRTRFMGECGAQPCRFEQSFSYDSAIVIDPPEP